MLTRWNPFQEMQAMSRLMDHLFEDMTGNLWSDTAKPIATPALDVVEKEEQVELHLDLPGVAPEQVNIEFKNGILTVSAEVSRDNEVKEENFTRRERYYGSYRRSLRVPEHLDVDASQAHFENGVLTLSLPKRPEAQPLRIPINGTKAIEAGK
jgi:HSP20 family protein